MDEKLFLTAKEARRIADSSNCVKNRVFKAINEESKQCHTELIWDIQGISDNIVKNLFTDLRGKGYEVDYVHDEEGLHTDNSEIIIKW